MPSRFLLLPLLATVALGCSRTPPPGPIVLGHFQPSHQEDEAQAIAMAVEAINGDPSRLPVDRKLKVIHAALGTKADEAQGQTTRLLIIDKVDGLLGPSHSAQVEKVAAASQTPPTVMVAFNGYVTSSVNSNCFPIGVAPAERGRALRTMPKRR